MFFHSPRRHILSLFAACSLLLIASCDTTETVAGTNNETQTKGTFFRPDGQPAAGARIQAYALESSIADSIPIALGVVDEQGDAKIDLPRGRYSFLVRDSDGLTAWTDTVRSFGDSLRIGRDTLREPGTIEGIATVPFGRRAEKATIYLPRTGLWTHPDSLGRFRINGVPEASLPLEAICGEADCIPTFRTLRATSGKTTDAGTIELLSSSLGTVTGLHGTYDPSTGMVRLQWADPVDSSVSGFVLFRTSTDAAQPSYDMEHYFLDSTTFSQQVFPTSNFWQDRSFSRDDSEYTYFVALRRKSGEISSRCAFVRITTEGPSSRRPWTMLEPLDSVVIPDSLYLEDYHIDSIGGAIAVTGTTGTARANQLRTFRTVFLLPGAVARAADYEVGPELEGRPIVWKGRIWNVTGLDPRPEPPSDPRFEVEDQLDLPWFASAAIQCSIDGVVWDTTILPELPPKSTNFRLERKSNSIFLHVRYQDAKGPSFGSRKSELIAVYSSTDGRIWAREMGAAFARTEWIDDFHGSISDVVNGYTRHFVPTSDTSDMTVFQNLAGARQTSIAAGFVADTAGSHWTYTNSVEGTARGNGEFLAMIQDQKLGLALTKTPNRAQLIEVPVPNNWVMATGFWRGNLIAGSGRTLYLIPLPPADSVR